MKKVIEELEQLGLKDPVVFAWMNMRKRSNLTDEQAIIYLVKALINHKNIALRVLEKNKESNKVIRIVR